MPPTPDIIISEMGVWCLRALMRDVGKKGTKGSREEGQERGWMIYHPCNSNKNANGNPMTSRVCRSGVQK